MLIRIESIYAEIILESHKNIAITSHLEIIRTEIQKIVYQLWVISSIIPENILC